MSNTTFIPLTIAKGTAVLHLSRGKTALIDTHDWDRVGSFVWSAAKIGKTYYAQRSLCHRRGQQRQIRLHRQLTDAPRGMDVDHDDGNGLNNRRSNLIISTRSQNLRNWHRPHPSTSATGFRGVYPHGDKFVARIGAGGKSRYLGVFASKKEAARAFDMAASAQYGPRAALNFPMELCHV
jgi:hypothetical protein